MQPHGMIPQPMAGASFLTWSRIPADIRVLILEMIAETKNEGWRSCAAVCKEWHRVIARANFQSLRLNNPHPRKFRDVVFEAVMDEYGCDKCPEPMELREMWGVSARLRQKLVDLFRLLGILEQTTKNSLTLHISVYFPSHTKHWFKNWHTTSDPTYKRKGGAKRPPHTWNDHGWVSGKQVKSPPLWALLRPFEVTVLAFPKELPSVSNVTRLGFAIFLTMRRTLKTVTYKRIPCGDVGASFAYDSLRLEKVSLAFMIDARDFFDTCQRSWRWPCLESLALTSRILCEPKTHQEKIKVENLFRAAGRVARRMPKLKTMVLWNGQVKNACAFIYHVGAGPEPMASITWRGTWEMELTHRVVAVWERVAEKQGYLKPLWVAQEHISKEDILSHGEAIHHLAMPCQVVVPELLWQIRDEGRSGAWEARWNVEP
ncbi:uncharacterized protein C8A04DRAFT_34055 [Dichotomopilus funicola]|uniref:DUF6546 domain-containing protein n=1 Tax=Dichotomopilus funicola TaxID=1934379 RepID=A0AAN6VAD8_9PEZI|nr:hypothetical protein C8A04DRAFT_34055 [Dichotomopilus funicola]